jgi:archaellum component FlaC
MKNTENDETRTKSEFILTEKDINHLQEAPIIDNSQFVIKTHTKTKEHHVNTAIISDADRRQYFSNGLGDDKNAKLAKKAKEAIKKIETDIEQKQYEAAKVAEAAIPIIKKENTSKDGDVTSRLDFSALITGAVLKDM